jgi:hypothetical protein
MKNTEQRKNKGYIWKKNAIFETENAAATLQAAQVH